MDSRTLFEMDIKLTKLEKGEAGQMEMEEYGNNGEEEERDDILDECYLCVICAETEFYLPLQVSKPLPIVVRFHTSPSKEGNPAIFTLLNFSLKRQL